MISKCAPLVLSLALVLFAAPTTYSQTAKTSGSQQTFEIAGVPSEIRSALMNANNVKFVMYNYGQFTRPNLTPDNTTDFVWHQLGYMYEFGPLFAAEVVDVNGNTVHILDDGMWLPSEGGYAPDGSIKWGWLPRSGYARDGQPLLAVSDDPTTWPASWSAWPGEQGSGVVLGLKETYYAIDDFTNAKYLYFPFPADSSKRGLGVSAEVRTYQFGGGLRDAAIISYRFKNESSKPLPKCYIGFYGDPHIGGAMDYADDLVSFIDSRGPVGDSAHYWARNTVFNWDSDGKGMGNVSPGYMSFKFLETPEHRDLTALSALAYGAPNNPKSDVLFWSLLSADSIDHNQRLFTTPGDNVNVFATGPFSLAAGDSTHLSLAIFFSENYADMINDANYIHFASHWPTISGSMGSHGGDLAYTAVLVSPDSGETSGSVPVIWQFTGSDANARVFLECSWDRGSTWQAIAWDHPVGEPFTWNTTTFRDGVNYLLRIVAHSADLSHYWYSVSPHRFTVNNPGDAQPELSFAPACEGTVVRTLPVNISWTAEDADNPVLHTTFEYAISGFGSFNTIANGDYPIGTNSYTWDITGVPNAPSVVIRLTVSDGVKDSVLVCKPFGINQDVGHYGQETVQRVAGKTTAALTLQVVDPAQVTGHRYEVTFKVPHPDSVKTARVVDKVTDVTLVNNFPILPGITTPPFDGLKLLVTDKKTDIDPARSGFHRAGLDSAVSYSWTAFYPAPQTKVPQDWIVVFNSLDTLADGSYVEPGDTTKNQLLQPTVCPFRIINLDSMKAATYVILDRPLNRRWDRYEPIVLQPQGTTGNAISYQLNLSSYGGGPAKGDTLFVLTDKEITEQDTFQFVADNSYILAVHSNERVSAFRLSQNYPNPFNPVSTIGFSIAESRLVTLKVYDILGREVAVLVNERMDAGVHEVKFDASGLASGVYLYRIQAGSFIATKKLLLLR